MSDNQSKRIVPQKSGGFLSKISVLAKRGMQVAQNPTSVQQSSTLAQFLDSVGGIPDVNTDLRLKEINGILRNYFSKMTMEEISKELEVEYQKRPNGRTLKLLGFSYFHERRFDDAIAVYAKTIEITSENPIAIYEDLGRCYILKGNWEKARLWFAESYRYDFEFFLEMFGLEFLYVTALGRYRTRPPIFGEFSDEFSTKALKIEAMADALSMCYGNNKGHKSLANPYVESIMVEMAEEYATNTSKAIGDTKSIKDTALQLLQELKTSKWQAKTPNVFKAGLDVLDTLLKSENEKKQVDKLLLEGQKLHQNGKTQQAIKTLEKALRVSDELHYESGKGSALGCLGLVYNQMGNPRLAVDYLDKALAISRSTSNRQNIGINLANLGNAYQNLGDGRRAMVCYEEALTIDREIGDQRAVADDLYGLGLAYSTTDNMHQAIENFEEALAIFRKIRDEQKTVSCLFGLATCFTEEDDPVRALPLAEEAIGLGDKIKHPFTQAAKELLAEIQTMYKVVINQAYQAFLGAETPLDMEQAVMRFPFLADNKFIDQLKNAEMPKSLDFDTRFSYLISYSKKVGWLEQIAHEEQFVSNLIDFDEEELDDDGFQTRCLRTYIPTMALSPKHELGFQAFLCTRSISELKKIIRNFPYMLTDSSFVTGIGYVIQSLPKYEHPEALQERLDALKQLKK